MNVTQADLVAIADEWTGDPAAVSPITAALNATPPTIDETAFAGTRRGGEVNAIIHSVLPVLFTVALQSFRDLGGQQAEAFLAARSGRRYPA